MRVLVYYIMLRGYTVTFDRVNHFGQRDYLPQAACAVPTYSFRSITLASLGRVLEHV